MKLRVVGKALGGKGGAGKTRSTRDICVVFQVWYTAHCFYPVYILFLIVCLILYIYCFLILFLDKSFFLT